MHAIYLFFFWWPSLYLLKKEIFVLEINIGILFVLISIYFQIGNILIREIDFIKGF